jgi:uncharacterized membrane protein HdeD (DUF308 family)
MTVTDLGRRLWALVLLRGVAAAGLGVSLSTVPTATASAVVARVAAYWVVDGAVLIGMAAMARRHGFGGWGLLARAVVPTLVGLWILGSPVVDVLGGRYRPGWFVSFLVLVPALLMLVIVQGIVSAVVDGLIWLSTRRALDGAWSGIVSAGLAVATSVLVFRAILGVAHPRVAAILALLAGAGFVLGAIRLRGARPPR